MKLERKRRAIGLLLATCVTVSGCSSMGGWFTSSEPINVPAELNDIAASISPTSVWSDDVGAGSDELHIKLQLSHAGGKIFAADREGNISAYDAQSGVESWNQDLDLPISAGPGVGDGLVVVASSQGQVAALRQSDGEILWKKQVSSEVLSAPAVGLDLVIVRTADGKLFALNQADGERRWVYDRTVPVLSLRGTGAPVVSADLVVAGFDNGRVLALTVGDGQIAWERRLATPRGRTELQRMVDIDADPVIDGRDVFAVSFQGNLAVFDLLSGEQQWIREMSSHAGLSVASNTIYVTDSQSHVWALDRASSKSLWKQTELEHRDLTAPVVAGNHLVVGDLEGYLHWIDRSDGRIVGRTQVSSSAISVTPILAGETLYYISRNGRIGAVR